MTTELYITKKLHYVISPPKKWDDSKDKVTVFEDIAQAIEEGTEPEDFPTMVNDPTGDEFEGWSVSDCCGHIDYTVEIQHHAS